MGAALAALVVSACASSGSAAPNEEPPPRPLPTAGLAGEAVAVYPLTMLLAEGTLGWDSLLAPRREGLDRADEMIGQSLTERSPEVIWVLPAELRRAARRAPGMLPDPDQIGTSLLRGDMSRVPDPLRAQIRMLTGVAGDRWALIPAALLFYSDEEGGGRAELTLVLADVRTGNVGWRTVVRGHGADPWSALREALASLHPGLPG